MKYKTLINHKRKSTRKTIKKYGGTRTRQSQQYSTRSAPTFGQKKSKALNEGLDEKLLKKLKKTESIKKELIEWKNSEKRIRIRNFMEKYYRHKRGIKIIPNKNISGDKLTMAYVGHKYLTEEQVKNFVDKEIVEGPQMVRFPVGGMSHTILVNIDIQRREIRLSDWRSDKFLNPPYEIKGQNYIQLAQYLKERYQGYSFGFYPVDDDLEDLAFAKHEDQGGTGGCSDYQTMWQSVYFPDGETYVPSPEPYTSFINNLKEELNKEYDEKLKSELIKMK